MVERYLAFCFLFVLPVMVTKIYGPLNGIFKHRFFYSHFSHGVSLSCLCSPSVFCQAPICTPSNLLPLPLPPLCLSFVRRLSVHLQTSFRFLSLCLSAHISHLFIVMLTLMMKIRVIKLASIAMKRNDDHHLQIESLSLLSNTLYHYSPLF